MTIQLNGEKVELAPDVKSVQDLLHFYDLHNRIVIVEHNHEIVGKEEYPTKRIKKDDTVEFIHFVGGG